MKKIFLVLTFLISINFINFDVEENVVVEPYNDYSIETLSSGATGGYEVNSPFNLSYRQSSYVSATGYLYAAGYNVKCEFGNGSTSTVTEHIRLYKNGDTTDYFKNPLDWSFTWYHGIVIDNDGTAWHAGSNFQGVFGQGSSSSSTSVTSNKYIEIATIGTSEYKAKSTDSGYYHSVIMLDDGSIWCAGQGSSFGKSVNVSKYEELIMPEGKEKSIIKDYAGGYTATWVLFEDGELWTTDTESNPWVKVADNVNFFDVDGSASYVYAVTNDNKILYGAETSTNEFIEISATLDGEPFNIEEEVIQVRSGGYNTGASWGFLTKSGNLYVADEKSNGNGDLEKVDATNVRYFDIGSSKDSTVTIYGYLDQYAQMYLWGDNGNGQLATGNTSDLSDPSYNESSVIIPSLDADFSGLYSIAPLIKKSVKDEVLDADALYMYWGDEGYLYVDYSNFDWSDEVEQKIDVSIANTKGVVTSFTLDKENQFMKEESYPTTFGLYIITSQLFTKVDGEWELDGSVNTTIFEIKLNNNLEFNNNLENITNDLYQVYVNGSKLNDSILNVISNSIKKGDIKFTEDLYTFDEKYEKYNLSIDDFEISLSNTNITSSGNYKATIKFKGLEGYYDEVETVIDFTIYTRANIISNQILLTNDSNTSVFSSEYNILINNSLFNDENYSVDVVITKEGFYKKYNYKEYNDFLNLEVGEYDVSVTITQKINEDVNITLETISNTISITKKEVSFSDNDSISNELTSLGISKGLDTIECLSDVLDNLLNNKVTINDIYYIENNELRDLLLNSNNISYTFYNENDIINEITKTGNYKVEVIFNNDNYTCDNLIISFYIKERVTLNDDCVVFDNLKNTIVFNNNEYSLIINDIFNFNDTNYIIEINITDNNGFDYTYYYSDEILWENMPKCDGEYNVEVILYDNTTSLQVVTVSYSNLEIIKEIQDNSIVVDDKINTTLNSFYSREEDFIDLVLESIDENLFSLEKSYYVIVRKNGIDSVVFLEEYEFNYEIYLDEDKITSVTYAATYELKVIMDELFVIIEFDVMYRTTMNNIEKEDGSIGVSVLVNDKDVVSFNEIFEFEIDEIESFNNHTIEVTIYNDYFNYSFNINNLNEDNLPKESGKYNVEIKTTDLYDDYITLTYKTFSIENINIEFQTIYINIDYNESSVSLSDEIINKYVEVLEIYSEKIKLEKLVYVENNEYKEVVISKDIYNIEFYSNDKLVNDVKDEGQYKIVISLKEEYTINYNELTFEDEFIINQLEKQDNQLDEQENPEEELTENPNVTEVFIFVAIIIIIGLGIIVWQVKKYK